MATLMVPLLHPVGSPAPGPVPGRVVVEPDAHVDESPGVLAIVYRAGSFSCDGGGSWLRCCRLPPARVEASDLNVDGSTGCGSFPGSAGSGWV